MHKYQVLRGWPVGVGFALPLQAHLVVDETNA